MIQKNGMKMPMMNMTQCPLRRQVMPSTNKRTR